MTENLNKAVRLHSELEEKKQKENKTFEDLSFIINTGSALELLYMILTMDELKQFHDEAGIIE